MTKSNYEFKKRQKELAKKKKKEEKGNASWKTSRLKTMKMTRPLERKAGMHRDRPAPTRNIYRDWPDLIAFIDVTDIA